MILQRYFLYLFNDFFSHDFTRKTFNMFKKLKDF